MVEVLFILFIGYICWRLFIVVWALLVQVILFFVKLVCLCILIMAIYFIIKNIKVELPSAQQSQLSYAIPIPGNRALVKSPYSDDGYIDTKNTPHGTIIKDPYSTNNLIVP